MCQEQELSEMQMDINEIQEAIKNHDLWVQDAVAMRVDIEDLQGAIREHEGWMGTITGVMRQFQARDVALQKELAYLRTQLMLSRPFADSAQGVEALESPAALSSPSTPSIDDHLLPGALGSAYPCGVPVLDRPSTPSARAGDGKLRSPAETQRLSWALEALERREEETDSQKQMNALAQVDMYLLSRFTEGFPKGSALIIEPLRSALDALEVRMGDKMIEAERMVLELRGEIASLRTELSLQAVTTGSMKLLDEPLQGLRPAEPIVIPSELYTQVARSAQESIVESKLSPTQACSQNEFLDGLEGGPQAVHDMQNATT